jgi:predicted dehydrogenase
MKLRVGLIGLGEAWESRHRSALLSLVDRFEVRAVCAEVAQRAERVAREFNAEAVDGFRAVTGRADVDAVLMLSSNWFGALPVLAACEAGKAVYCASALDIDRQQAQEVKQRVERSGIAFMAEFPRRHAPATLRLKELLATCLGPPQLLFCHLRTPRTENRPSARNGRSSPTVTRGLLELVDWCRYVVGQEPTSVMSVRHTSNRTPAEEDYQMMSLDFSHRDAAGSGPLAQISCGRYFPSRWQEAIAFRPPAALQVSCANGIAFVDLPSSLIWFDDAGRHMESLDSERPAGEQLLTQFHRAVTSLLRRTGDLEDAYRSLEIVHCAAQSQQEGRRIDLSEPMSD